MYVGHVLYDLHGTVQILYVERTCLLRFRLHFIHLCLMLLLTCITYMYMYCSDVKSCLIFIRPTVQEVLSHCLFWTKEKQLAFLQDVSDRIEKEAVTSFVVRSLEQGAINVVGRDWKTVIGEELRNGKYMCVFIYMYMQVMFLTHTYMYMYIKHTCTVKCGSIHRFATISNVSWSFLTRFIKSHAE